MLRALLCGIRNSIQFSLSCVIDAIVSGLWYVAGFVWSILLKPAGTFFWELLMTLIGVQTNRAILASARTQVKKINALEVEVSAMTQEEMIEQTREFQEALRADKKTLDEILPKAFAMVREVARRTMGMRHYDVQLIGGIAMHRGMIAEMCTGEGKTLAATLPAYLNALAGAGVHIVTVNDYLAKRDSEWMSQIYKYLGLRVGCITQDSAGADRQAAYAADITYITNNELGFDYLRDHTETESSRLKQRERKFFAIVDEVDSILIDEARTPLIISGPSENSAAQYEWVDTIVRTLVQEDYSKDEKQRTVVLTDTGVLKVEEAMRAEGMLDADETLYIVGCTSIVHAVTQSLKAHVLYEKDIDYLVDDGEVKLIDEFTGRIMEGRRLSDGLHQAIEAKEGVEVLDENITLASITYQLLFRMYEKLTGMTGTAATEAEEFRSIYNLNVLSIPTHVAIARIDRNDLLYRTYEEKIEAICSDVMVRRESGQPVLVGTASVEKSEEVSRAFMARGIPHETLNARNHAREAEIIANAGKKGAVTIATNMAGRGTDIKLGGKDEVEREEVKALGGLLVVGTERHESRRIDNQLRGRSGRQGDPGESRFYLSLEDKLARIFQAEQVLGPAMEKYCEQNEPLEDNIVNISITSWQKKVEAINYENRKHVLKYDEVMNEQRNIVYGMRQKVLIGNEVECSRYIMSVVIEAFEGLMEKYSQGLYDESQLCDSLKNTFGLAVGSAEKAFETVFNKVIAEENVDSDVLLEALNANRFEQEVCGLPAYQHLRCYKHIEQVRKLFLMILDRKWQGHLTAMDHLRHQCQLQAYAQQNPLSAYKNEALPAFEHLMDDFKQELCISVGRVLAARD